MRIGGGHGNFLNNFLDTLHLRTSKWLGNTTRTHINLQVWMTFYRIHVVNGVNR